MRSMDSVRTASIVGLQFVVTVLCGLALAFLIGRTPMPIAFGLVFAALLGLVFLRRPSLALLFVLVVRASSDASLSFVGRLLGGRQGPLAALMSPNAVLVLILILGGGLFVLSHRVTMINLPGGRLFALLLLAGLVGVTRSPSFLAAMNEWLPVLSVLIVYSLVVDLFRTPDHVQTVIDVIGASFVLPAVFGFYELVQGGNLYRGIGLARISSTFVVSNAFAIYLVIILGVFVGQFFAHSGRRRAVALLIMAAAATLLVGTFTRMAWIGAIIVLLVVGALRKRVILFLVPVLGLLLYQAVPAVRMRLHLEDPMSGTAAGRLELWQSTYGGWIELTRVEREPVSTLLNRLTGLGPGASDVVIYSALGRVFGTHNDYMGLLVEYGVFGLLVYVILYGVIAVTAFRAWRSSPDNRMASVALSFVALALAFPVMGLTDNIFAHTVVEVYFWTLAGLTVAIARMAGKAGEVPSLVGQRRVPF